MRCPKCQTENPETRKFCRECGACVTGCLAAKFGSGFDPREIMLKVRYGLADRLLTEHSVLWQCFQCNGCHERCPSPVKPVEVITCLREMLPERVWRREEPSQSG